MGRNATEFASIIYNIRGGKGNASVILAQQLLKLSPSFSSVDIEIDKFRRSDFFLWDIISSKNASTDLVNELKYAGRASCQPCELNCVGFYHIIPYYIILYHILVSYIIRYDHSMWANSLQKGPALVKCLLYHSILYHIRGIIQISKSMFLILLRPF